MQALFQEFLASCNRHAKDRKLPFRCETHIRPDTVTIYLIRIRGTKNNAKYPDISLTICCLLCVIELGPHKDRGKFHS